METSRFYPVYQLYLHQKSSSGVEPVDTHIRLRDLHGLAWTVGACKLALFGRLAPSSFVLRPVGVRQSFSRLMFPLPDRFSSKMGVPLFLESDDFLEAFQRLQVQSSSREEMWVLRRLYFAGNARFPSVNPTVSLSFCSSAFVSSLGSPWGELRDLYLDILSSAKLAVSSTH